MALATVTDGSIQRNEWLYFNGLYGSAITEYSADEAAFEKQTITYEKGPKKFKGEREIKLGSLPHVKEIHDIQPEDRICEVCGKEMKCVVIRHFI